MTSSRDVLFGMIKDKATEQARKNLASDLTAIVDKHRKGPGTEPELIYLLVSIGSLYESMGELDLAFEYYGKALDKYRSNKVPLISESKLIEKVAQLNPKSRGK